MLRHRDGLLTPPHSLRRRQQTEHSEAGPPGFGQRSGHVLSGCSNQTLDLSVCHPSQAFSNRFSVLATTPPLFDKTPSFFRDFPATNARGRTRNSRGTKEAKKRRDMRRNRRKLAAQMLDQQLSQAVDETLTKANIHPPPPPPRARLMPALSASTSGIPSTGVVMPQPAWFPPTPPELPMPHFTSFDLSEFPYLPTSSRTPPPRISTPFRTLPAWCPKIPSLTLIDVWRDRSPTFYDLSALPEPADTSTKPGDQAMEDQKCRDLQLWRPMGPGFGREHSRFFPPQDLSNAERHGVVGSKKTRVKLPSSTACRLHLSDSGAGASHQRFKSVIAEAAMAALATLDDEIPPTLAIHDHNEPAGTASHLCTEPESLATSASASDPADVLFDESTAATLWRILAASQAIHKPVINSAYLMADDATKSQGFGDLYQTDDRSKSSINSQNGPYELEGREIALPYVHANSLTGHSNASEDTVISPDYSQRQCVPDSSIELPVEYRFDDYDVGLNELMVDHDFAGPMMLDFAAGTPLPPSPPETTPSGSIANIAALLPIECVTEAEYRDSDAHFHSEQALFLQSPPSYAESMRNTQKGLEFSSIDIAEFLKLGHARHCWCSYCSEEAHEAAANATSSSTALSEEDDDAASTLTLLSNPIDSNTDVPELLNLTDSTPSPQLSGTEPAGLTQDNDNDDDDWLLFTPLALAPSAIHKPYLPSSPILHRQHQQQDPTPAIVVTSS